MTDQKWKHELSRKMQDMTDAQKTNFLLAELLSLEHDRSRSEEAAKIDVDISPDAKFNPNVFSAQNTRMYGEGITRKEESILELSEAQDTIAILKDEVRTLRAQRQAAVDEAVEAQKRYVAQGEEFTEWKRLRDEFCHALEDKLNFKGGVTWTYEAMLESVDFLQEDLKNWRETADGRMSRYMKSQEDLEELRKANDNLAVANQRQGNTIAELKADVRDAVAERDDLRKADEMFRRDMMRAFGFYGTLSSTWEQDAIVTETEARTAKVIEYQNHATNILTALGVTSLDAAHGEIAKLQSMERTWANEIARLRAAIDAYCNDLHHDTQDAFWRRVRAGESISALIGVYDKTDPDVQVETFEWKSVQKSV